MSDQAIETLFEEDRRYPPPPEFAAQANAKPGIYDVPFEEFWEREGRERVTWFEPFTSLARVGSPVREVVRRREDQRRLQLPRPARRGRSRRIGSRYYYEGEPVGERAAITYSAAPRRGRPRCERPEGARRREGNAGRDLHGDGAWPSRRDARVRAARRAAHGRLRRLLGRGARRPAERHALRGAPHAGRELPARRARSAQAERRRGARVMPRRAHGRRRPADARRRPDDRRARPHLERARGRAVDGSGVVPLRADGLRGSPVPPVHERHDREAEGHRAHDRRLPRRRGGHPPLRLRPEARGRRLLVRCRHRLGDGAQLHRLRAALQRRDERPLRGDAGLPGQGPLVGHRRALQGDDPLHGADGHPRAHEVGARARGEARPHVAPAARLGRRADQPRGVDVVPRAHRARAHADRGHVVADRDGDDPHHAAPGRHDDEARLRDEAVSRASRPASSTTSATTSVREAAATSC